MMWSRNTELSQPGEYGGRHQPNGWVVITLPELANQTIYLASEDFAHKLAQKHKIPEANIVNLNHPTSQQKSGIPEEKLDGKQGLQLFSQRLRHINRRKNPVIIHCKRGTNRTPVAAVMYLVSQHIDPQRAVEIVTDAYRQWRDPNFVLDKRGHYEHVLREIGVVQPSLGSDRRLGVSVRSTRNPTQCVNHPSQSSTQPQPQREYQQQQ